MGSHDDRLSDPSNQDRDMGVVPFNQTHTFVASALLAPRSAAPASAPSSPTTTSSGSSCSANSGLPFNVRSNLDLNQDGVTNDRPLDIERNSGRLGRC